MAVNLRPDYYTSPEFQMFENATAIAGALHRKSECGNFIAGKGHSIVWRQGPGNTHDPNAIQIIGTTKGMFSSKQHIIGYVPAEIAARIANGDWFSRLIPRLRYLRLTNDGYITIEFDIIGPKGEKKAYLNQ